MRHLVFLLCLAAGAADAQLVAEADSWPTAGTQAGTSISTLQGGAVLLGAAFGAVSGGLLASSVDSATFTLVSYPIISAAGAYAAGRLVRADGTLFGALAGGVVGALPGYLIILVDESSDDALFNISFSGVMVFLIGPPIGAALGYYVVPRLLAGPNDELVPGASLRIQF